MTRTCAQLVEWIYTVPRDALPAVTVAEVMQYADVPIRQTPDRRFLLCGRPVIVIDLPPDTVLYPWRMRA